MSPIGGCAPAPKVDPNVNQKKTKAIAKQFELITAPDNKKLGSKKFKFSFEFKRIPEEVKFVEKVEGKEGKYKYVNSKGYMTCEEKGQEKNTGNYIYKAKVNLTVAEAARLLADYGINMVFLAEYKFEGRDFPREAKQKGDPRGGVRGKLPAFPDLMSLGHMQGDATFGFSHHFDVRSEYWPGTTAKREEFIAVRKRIWHEVMETALIALAAEALYAPNFLRSNLEWTGIDNFADDCVMLVQQTLNDDLFLYWSGDPPFDAWESQARTYEAEAKRLEEIAIMLEQQGNFSCAANRWEEAENAWERAVEAWQAIPGHPEREKRISAARAKLAEAKERKEAALWKSAWWDASKTSRGEISIRYSSWPDRFKARIVDVGGNVLARFEQPGGTGVVTWGKGAKAGVYFIKVEAERVEPTVRKVVVP